MRRASLNTRMCRTPWNACADTHFRRAMSKGYSKDYNKGCSKEYSKECNKVKKKRSSKRRGTSWIWVFLSPMWPRPQV